MDRFSLTWLDNTCTGDDPDAAPAAGALSSRRGGLLTVGDEGGVHRLHGPLLGELRWGLLVVGDLLLTSVKGTVSSWSSLSSLSSDMYSV